LQEEFARALGLIPTPQIALETVGPKIKPNFLPLIQKYAPKPKKTKKRRRIPKETPRIQLTRFFKSSKLPVKLPITSGLGLQLVKDFDHYTSEEKEKCSLEVSQFCTGISCDDTSDTPLDMNEAETSIKVPDDYCHQYNFNPLQRLRRNQELVLGSFLVINFYKNVTSFFPLM
jgi:hypothetical protein